MKYSLLIIDDDPAKDSIERLVAPAGFSVSLCKSAADFERETAATSTKHHVALIDYRLGARFAPRYEDGIAITRVLLDRYHEVGVVGYSAFLDAKFDPRWDDTVAKWLVAGARWFCDKTSLMAGLGFEVTLQVLLQCAARAEEWKALKRQASGLDLADFKGLSNTLDTLDRIARLPSPVLILGETGTGKELLAKRLHHLGTYATETK